MLPVIKRFEDVRTTARRVLGVGASERQGGSGPHRLLIDPTYHCNLRCISCHSPQVATFFKGEQRLTGDEYARVIDEFAQLGGKRVDIYGGEPLLVEETFVIVGLAAQANLIVHMCTNGLLLNRERAARLLDAGLNSLTVSIDGVGETFDRIRGRGKFNQLVAGITAFRTENRSRRRPIPLTFHVTVMRQNVGRLSEIVPFAAEQQVDTLSFACATRVDRERDRATQELLRGSFRAEWDHWNLPDDIMLTDTQVPAVRAELRRVSEEARSRGIEPDVDPALVTDTAGTDLSRCEFHLTKPCRIADETVMLGPSGFVNLCPMLTHFPVANIRQNSLSEYWTTNETLSEVRRLLNAGDYLPICSHCCNHAGLM